MSRIKYFKKKRKLPVLLKVPEIKGIDNIHKHCLDRFYERVEGSDDLDYRIILAFIYELLSFSDEVNLKAILKIKRFFTYGKKVKYSRYFVIKFNYTNLILVANKNVLVTLYEEKRDIFEDL